MARMKVDCNLKKLANFSKFFLCILEKSMKADYSSFFLNYFLPSVVRAISCYKLGSLSNSLSGFDQNTAKSL